MALRRTEWRGLPIVIENEPGSYRKWSGGQTLMRYPYGYFADHAGSDGDELDCYIGPDPSARFVYVVHQLAPDGTRDEGKVMLDFRDEAAAKAGYLAHRNDGDRAYGGMSVIPAEDFIAKLARRTGDGKIRHSIMGARLFSLASCRFSIVDPSSAIGKWSRVATFGPKSKDGSDMVFDATTLGQMVDNAASRGDRIAICNDHASAYPETRDAPALGFFGALAVVAGGKVVKAWNGEPDAAGMEDGLYARLDEVTPRGMDPLVGLANYRTLSPMFRWDGKDEADKDIGPSLLDVGATNIPFQAGAELMFHRVDTEEISMAVSKGEWVAVKGGPNRGRKGQVYKIEGSTVSIEASNGDTFKADMADVERNSESGYSADPGAARRFSQGAGMDPDTMKRFGIEDGDDDAKKAEKMAAFWAGYEGMAARCAKFDADAADAKAKADEDEKAMTALSQALTARGVTVPAGASRAVLMSLATLSPAQVPDVSALVKAEIARVKAEEAAAAESKEREQLVTMARTAKAPEYEIVALGQIPLANAREMAAKYGAAHTGAPAHLFSRHSHQGAPLGGPTAAGARSIPDGRPVEHVRQMKNGDTVVEKDGALAEIARGMHESKDPVIMSRVDSLASSRFGGKGQMERLLAAQQLAAEDHPHLNTRAG